KALERAAILHAEAHQGSRYFEIGHDWLAKKVSEQRLQREQDRRDDEQQQQLARLKRLRGRLTILAVISVVAVLITGLRALVVWRQNELIRSVGVCREGDLRCDGNAPQSCHGFQWQTLGPCATSTCSEGRCVGE